MDFSTWIIVIAVAAVGIAVLQHVVTSNKKERMESSLRTVSGFNATQTVLGCDGSTGLAVDETRQLVCLLFSNESQSPRTISYKDILSAELFEDGSSVTKTARGSQVGGAIVGGLMLGGVGAIIGGLSGKTVTTGKVKRVELRLTINDTKAPLHDIAFMNTEGAKDGIVHTAAMQLARRWLGIADILIKAADAEARNNHATELPSSSAPKTNSVADEIRKLAELHQAGVLTSDEFQTQKKKLLGVSPPAA
jgi:hypothetical protein